MTYPCVYLSVVCTCLLLTFMCIQNSVNSPAIYKSKETRDHKIKEGEHRRRAAQQAYFRSRDRPTGCLAPMAERGAGVLLQASGSAFLFFKLPLMISATAQEMAATSGK